MLTFYRTGKSVNNNSYLYRRVQLLILFIIKFYYTKKIYCLRTCCKCMYYTKLYCYLAQTSGIHSSV